MSLFVPSEYRAHADDVAGIINRIATINLFSNHPPPQIKRPNIPKTPSFGSSAIFFVSGRPATFGPLPAGHRFIEIS